MKHPFVIYQTQYGYKEKPVWVGESLTLKGCVSQGNTLDEALSELESNEKEWLKYAPEMGIEIPNTLIKNKGNILRAKIETHRIETGYYNKTPEERMKELQDSMDAIENVSDEEAKINWEIYKSVRGR